MPSPRRDSWSSVALTLLVGLIAIATGFGRRSYRVDRHTAPAPPPSAPAITTLRYPRISLSAMVVLALVVLGLVYGGYAYKRDRNERALAVAVTGGDPDLAPRLMVYYGCGGCHTIPGIRGANGQVGPPLQAFSRRSYVGGVMTNTPDHLVEWIVNPRGADPRTAMPATGISPEEARHVAAYLYTLR